MKAIGYVRVSRDEQQEGITREKRRAKIRACRELNDLDLAEIFLPLFRECFPPGFFAFSISPSKPPSRPRSFPLFPTFSISWTLRRPARSVSTPAFTLIGS